MSDPFLDAEAGIESSQPRELFEIVINGLTFYRIASGVRDITYIGNVFYAQPAARDEVAVAMAGGESGNVTIALPLSHAFVQRYLAQGSPPRQVTVTVYRQQGGLTEQFVTGNVTLIAIEKHLAKLTVQQRLTRLLTRSLPVFKADTRCPHVLYDVNCRFPRGLGTIGDDGTPVTITGFDGRTITINDIGGEPDRWAQNGELLHLPTNERMPILDQVGTRITMQAPVPGMQVGDAVYVSAGCAKDIVTCRVKFANQINFGGFPQMPKKNPFTPTGLGMVEQT